MYVRTYGITIREYEEMVMAQCGACAICGEMETTDRHRTGAPDRLAIHHCDDTGRIVALLCSRCNVGMGKFDDRPDLLRRAADLQERV